MTDIINHMPRGKQCRFSHLSAKICTDLSHETTRVTNEKCFGYADGNGKIMSSLSEPIFITQLEHVIYKADFQ